ncbi:uncharacterized protein SAPINGB_P002555 [Magnusiomyces paraingens]|uniref:Cas1p 10 TM acyl transferase domain-containing protein n=1 Tax=Magnusiomyces paraingens TaxID=2606893 RepID=A0A5E8BES2_9ASCO|nr:uncharacterized protein SAPINGB_P002555 [Saprochaete ingens]VVT50009.1 unnamed protein product [Saprochaete ingens]
MVSILPQLKSIFQFFKSKPFGFAIISFVAIIAIIANWIHLSQYSEPDHPTSFFSSNCNSILKYGRYLNDVHETPSNWQPDGCVLKHYRSYYQDNLQSCFKPGDEIYFFGDSTARQVFWGFTTILFRQNLPLKGGHGSLSFEQDGITLNFVWDQLLDSIGANITANIAKLGLKAKEREENAALNTDKSYQPKTYIYTTVGPWYTTTVETKFIAKTYDHNIGRFLETLENQIEGAFAGVYLAPALNPAYPFLNELRTSLMKPEKYHKMSAQSDKLFNYVRTNKTVSSKVNPALYPGGVRYQKKSPSSAAAYYVPVFNELSAENHRGMHDGIGVHYLHDGFLTQANILINHMCNERLAEENMIEAGTCCIPYIDRKGNFSIFGLIGKISVFVPLFVLLFFIFEDVILALKYSALSVVIFMSVATWAHLSNESPLISKVELLFSSTEFWGMLQTWVVIVLVSAIYSEPSVLSPSSAFLAELQGTFATLYIIVQYSGATTLFYSFRGEFCARVLLSMWLILQIYELTSVCLDQLDPTSLAISYSQIIPIISKAFARALALPLFLGLSVSDITRKLPPNSPAPSYVDVTSKIIFGITFIFFILPLVSILKAKVADLLQQDDETAIDSLPIFKRFFMRRKISCTIISETAFIVMILICFHVLSLFFLYAKLSGVLARALNAITDDYWVLIAGVWIALLQQSFSISDIVEVSTTSIIVAIVVSLGLINIVLSYVDFYLPVDPFDLSLPTPYIQVNRKLYYELLLERGKVYTPLLHLFFVVTLLACYTVMRIGLLQRFSRDVPVFSSVLIAASGVSYEMLLLYPYVLLAVGGTVRLHYLPTGIVHSSLITRTYDFVGKEFKFPYTWWHIVEKLRKTGSMVIGAGVLWMLASISASVWTDLWPEQLPVPVEATEMNEEENKLEEFELV